MEIIGVVRDIGRWRFVGATGIPQSQRKNAGPAPFGKGGFVQWVKLLPLMRYIGG